VKALVISHQHALLPFAWRLRQENWDVQVFVDRDSWEKAWKGRFDPLVRGKGKRAKKTIHRLRESVESEEPYLLCDSPFWLSVFRDYPKLYGVLERPEGADPLPPLLVGGWFDGEQFSARHLLVEDQGLWPGGMGPSRHLAGGFRGWPTACE